MEEIVTALLKKEKNPVVSTVNLSAPVFLSWLSWKSIYISVHLLFSEYIAFIRLPSMALVSSCQGQQNKEKFHLFC